MMHCPQVRSNPRPDLSTARTPAAVVEAGRPPSPTRCQVDVQCAVRLFTRKPSVADEDIEVGC